MGDLVVQQFVSADGFAANDQNEFDLVDRLEGDSSAFDQSNLVARERRGDFEEATIESDDAAEAIRRLESEVRGDLVLWGSLSLPHSLWRAGAIDLVRLVMVPVVLGSGRGVFPADSPTSQLRLVASDTVSGLVAVDYAVDFPGH